MKTSGQDKARQSKADSQKHRGVTSGPDDTKLNRDELKYTLNETNTAGTDLTHNHIKQGQETNQIWTQEEGTHDTHDRGLTLGGV